MSADHLVDLVLRRADIDPHAVALVTGDGDAATLRYGQLRRRILAVRQGLVDAGLSPGDGVLFSVRPSARSLVLALAVVAARGVVIFADPGAGPEMFTARLRLAAPRWAAAESVLYAASRLPPLRRLARRRGLHLPNLTHLPVDHHVYTGRWLPGVPRHALPLSTLEQTATGPAPDQLDPDDTAVIIFTSGTTEHPRAVVHTGASLAAALELFHTRVPINPGDVVHTDQLMLGLPTLISGARWSLPPLGGSPTTFTDHLRSRGATHTYCVPTHLAEVLDASGDTLPAHLRHVILGSAPAPAPLLRRTIAAAPHADVTSVYAMTEILPVAIATAADKLAHTASGATGDLLGSPLPGVDVALTPDGELLLRGPNRCSGYLGDPPPEWLPTGDLARLDDAGRIVLIGRKKDMIIRDGFNLYPGLYEPAIRAEHGVADAAYVGVPHPDTGDEHVVLAVVPTTPNDHTLVQHLTRRLPHIVDHGAMPDRIVLTRELPRSGRSRKLDRAALRSLVQG